MSSIPKTPILPNTIDDDGSTFVRMLKDYLSRVSNAQEDMEKRIKALEDKVNGPV